MPQLPFKEGRASALYLRPRRMRSFFPRLHLSPITRDPVGRLNNAMVIKEPITSACTPLPCHPPPRPHTSLIPDPGTAPRDVHPVPAFPTGSASPDSARSPDTQRHSSQTSPCGAAAIQSASLAKFCLRL